VIRVLLAEDQEMVRGALAALLGMEADIEVVAQVGRGDEVIGAALAARPDVALLDIEMPGIDGLDAAAALRDALPACKVLILTTFGRPGYLARAMQAGVSGFLVKDAPAEQLATAIRRALEGARVVDPTLAASALAAGPNPLTKRECEVLEAAVDGATVADIAATLFLSEGTVRNYLSTAIAKTGSRNRVEAARLAAERGWL
jgi:two-component system response regulator DesR